MSDTCPGLLDRAEAGDGQAMFELAEEHRRAAECDGKLESWPDAHRWYRRAINAGVASAACELGICLLEARGVPMDVDLGFTWVRRAATDFPTAGRSDKDRGREMARLGECYLRGEGVGRDAATAVGWLTRAAELGHERSQLSLAACYARGTGVKSDIEQARAWAERAAVTCIDGAAREFMDALAAGRAAEYMPPEECLRSRRAAGGQLARNATPLDPDGCTTARP